MSLFTPKTLTLRDGSALVLRSPEVADAEALLERLDRVRRESTGISLDPGDDLPTLEWERRWIEERRSAKGVQILAIADDGEIAGMCGCSPGSTIRSRHRANLGISLTAAWCGRGLGTALMAELIAWAEADEEIEVLCLCVNADNPRAIHVYEKVGFVREGERRWGTKRGDLYIGEVQMSRWVGRGPEPPSATD
ncbi:MAG: GNAT family protein [Planctomycetota bacterium]